MAQNNNFELVNFSNLSLFDFDRIARAWKLDFLQMESGSLSSILKQYITDDYQLGYARFNKKVKQEGFSPEGVWTFAFVNEVKIYWRNYIVEPNSMIIYAPGSEINAVSDANFEVITFSISEKFLIEKAKQEGIEDFYHTLKSFNVLVSKNPLRSKLRKTILNEIDMQIQNPNVDNNKFFKESFTKELLVLLRDSTISKEKVSGIKRLKLLYEVERYMIHHITEPIKISEIASNFKVSERTLLYAFRNRFDMGPKSFMLLLKLNHVHHRLFNNINNKSVATIARDSGFWHMGQFYRDFKKHFGVLPSEILKHELN